MAERIAWDSVPWVFVDMPKCPACRCPDYHRVRTIAASARSKTHLAICRHCSRPYRIGFEGDEDSFPTGESGF